MPSNDRVAGFTSICIPTRRRVRAVRGQQCGRTSMRIYSNRRQRSSWLLANVRCSRQGVIEARFARSLFDALLLNLGVMWRQTLSIRKLIGVSTEVTHATGVASNSDRPVQRLRSAQGRGHVHGRRSECLYVRPLRRAGGSTADVASTADAASTASGRGTLPILSSASVEG